MPKNKHPIYRLHKIIVHPNRWLVWAIAYTILVAAALVSYIRISEINIEIQTADNQFQSWRIFTNPSLGYSLRYPPDWLVEIADDKTIHLVPGNSIYEGVNLIVTEPSAETEIRNGLEISDEIRTSLDGKRAVKIINSYGGGYSESVVMALRSGRLYVMRGPDTMIQKLLLTFRFLD